LERDKAFQARLVLTRKAMHLFSRYPFFGIGPGNFYYMWVDLELPRALRGKRDKINRIGAHNAYGQLLAEGGLAMAVPFFLLVGGLFYRGFPAVVRLVRCGDTWAAGFFAMFVGMSMHFVTIAGLGDTSTFMVYGLVAGVIVFDYRRAVSGVGRREGMKNSGGFAGQTHGPPGLGSEVQRSRFLG
jgi:O-antigen ligase